MKIYHIDKYHPRYEMVCHWHTEYELLRVTEGELRLTLNEHRYLVRKGDVFMITAGILHSALPERDKCVYDCVVFNMSYFAGKDDACSRYISDLLDYTVLFDEQISFSDPELSSVTDRLFSALINREEGYQLAAKGLFYQLFALLYKNGLYVKKPVPSGRNKKRVSTLKNVLSVIEESYDSQITLKNLADTAGMSPGYFCAFFKEMTDKTPIEYLIGYRIEQACRQLKKSELSVTDIAFGCGFNDLSHFIKTFKKLKNTTPEKFRRNAVKNGTV